MDYFVIRGGTRLEGTVEISGAKNAALPIMAACLMADGPTILHGVPRLTDTDCLGTLLRELGCRVDRAEPSPIVSASSARGPSLNGALTIEVIDEDCCEAPDDLVQKMRASISVLGPLLARRGRAVVPVPGGCKFGTRPIDLHLKGLERLGAQFETQDGCVVGTVPGGRLRGATMYLGGTQGPTVLGTLNIMCAAALAEGVTRIVGAACEPEIADCANLLNKMGARISGAGTPQITIEGVESLRGCEHTVIPDRIEAGTFMIAAAITGGELTLRNADADHLVAFTHLLESCGVDIRLGQGVSGHDIVVRGTGRARPADTTTWPYPGFPTDLQAQLMTLLSLADGNSVITERIYPERFAHAGELNRLGAQVKVSNGVAFVNGVDHLTGATVAASDLRASAALVIAGLAARGTTVVESIHFVDRGYEKIEEKLAAVGARIERAHQKPKISVAISNSIAERASVSSGTPVVA
jgi:UDP-N-acetylglucosamine 1-carboxyvinyltransferase